LSCKGIVLKELHFIPVGSWGNAGKSPRFLHLYEYGSGQSFARVRAAGNHLLESEEGCKDVVAETISLYLPGIEYQSFNPGLVPSLLFM
jgi:hypothetical protein